MDENNTTQDLENKVETPATEPIIPAGQPSPFQPVPQAVTYQQPAAQQMYYARPVPNGYGMYAQPVQQVSVQQAVPVQQVPQYPPRTQVVPASQAHQQAAQTAPKTVEQKTSSNGSGNGGKRSVVFPVICSILIAILFLYSAGQTFYIASLNKKITDSTSQTTEATSENTDETGPEESGDPTESEEPTETNEDGKPWFSIDKGTAATDPNRKALRTTEIVAAASPATIPVYIMKGTGSSAKKAASGTGFIISKDGYIVTNAHVVKYVTQSPYSYKVTVLLPDDTDPVDAEIVGSDSTTDIAVLKVKADRDLPFLKFGDSDKLQSGELVVAIGNAMGQLDDTVTVGVVSATNRDISASGYMIKVIQTDAAINNGNSGGPLLNSFGEVVGITNAKINSSISEGLGFAIPVNSVKEVIESIINYGKVTGRPYLGISVKKYNEGEYEEGAEAGVYVVEVTAGGPAAQAGVKTGDRLVSLDGVEIKSSNDIIVVRDSHKVGDSIPVVVMRGSAKVTLTLVIGDINDFQDDESGKKATPTPKPSRRTERDPDEDDE
ncbi:MAG: trypsin-like peptidase domain-containing protein [Clostridiales bacterium]|nr:trypsin-like peptidase domain-containing protein [Clostridiales bacterium]